MSWFVPGRTSGERRFFVYFNKQVAGAAATLPPPLPDKVAVLREAGDDQHLSLFRPRVWRGV